jgi:hypothetical protein
MSQTLKAFVQANGLDPRFVMNALQENCIVSDNCVELHEVGNRMAAIEWLVGRGIKDLKEVA